MSQQKIILNVQNLTKRFPGVVALNGVQLQLKEGEFLSLIGENGAGKSTLMKILAGVQLQDEGTVEVFGKPVRMDSVRTAQLHGIALIHQELNLSENLSIAANIFLGREPAKAGFIDKATIDSEARRFLDMVGLQIDPETLAGELSIGQQQLVEIAKALSINARILIMDEPTSSLSAGETQRLFEVIAELRERDVSIIYISHRLAEVKMLSDRVTIFRDGEYAGDLSGDEITHDAMVKQMVGRDISQYYSHQPNPPGDAVLKISRLRTEANPEHELSFQIHQGEIVGISGLVGAGRTELLDALFGVTPAIGGTIEVSGQIVTIENPSDAINLGMGLVPEDRKGQGLVIQMSVKENTSMASLKTQAVSGIFRNAEREAQDTAEMIDRLRTKTPNADQTVGFLSGGNQQKVVLGKWLATSPTLLLLDEPTRGIDIGAKQEIYHLMEELASQGMAVLFVSSELEEIIGMSDRTIVMHEGRITGELHRDQLTEESIMQLATGGISY